VQHGRDSGANIVNDMPWSFSYAGHPITHETDDSYVIPTLEGAMLMTRGDMLITGVKGEIYPCKADIFAATYDAADSMTFGHAVEALKQGNRVARAGWNGKGMFLYIVKGADLQTGLKYGYGEYVGEPRFVDSICMKAANNDLVVGWLASQTDVLADDWLIV
jgi:hypothetical protein